MSTFYDAKNDYRNYIAHYGVKNMRWGYGKYSKTNRHALGSDDPRERYRIPSGSKHPNGFFLRPDTVPTKPGLSNTVRGGLKKRPHDESVHDRQMHEEWLHRQQHTREMMRRRADRASEERRAADERNAAYDRMRSRREHEGYTDHDYERKRPVDRRGAKDIENNHRRTPNTRTRIRPLEDFNKKVRKKRK